MKNVKQKVTECTKAFLQHLLLFWMLAMLILVDGKGIQWDPTYVDYFIEWLIEENLLQKEINRQRF
ncbi:hypothetical protein ACFFHM_15345 [Halalkalibacter kiskunsagensis]|uniref:Uncharacterized protein n=1 Tax=Halalkalibacter kiskunsagensis TaxID=1548599 RepID=A0ABV6KES7_9BACI